LLNIVNAEAKGVIMKDLNSKIIRNLEFPVPTLAKQKKIVARLDSLSEKIRRVQDCQKSTQADLAVLEQSILHKAFLREL
jgi:type I restriction enzyme S subunit